MSELQSLFLVVLLIYLIQCIYWVPPGAVVFALDFRGGGKRKLRGFVWQALKAEGFLAWPLPPLSPLAVAVWPGFELNPELVAFHAADGGWTLLPWTQVAVTRSESKLRVNGNLVFHGSEDQVLEISALLERLRRMDKGARAPVIQRWLRRAMRRLNASRRVHVFAGRSRLLRILANIQLFFLFLAAPLAFARFGPGILWRVILFLIAMQALIALEFWTVHKKLFRQSGGARFKSALTVLLSPVAAIRACDALARDLFSRSHPLAAAGAVLPGDEFARFAGEQLRQCLFTDHPCAWYQENLVKLMDRAIRQAGARPEALLQPAEREGGCVVYCPRCLAQYIKASGACSDCGFANLVPFAGRAEPVRGAE